MAINYLEPIAPLKKVDEATGDINYIYPITTANQVVMADGERLNTILTENLLYLEDEETSIDVEENIINADLLNNKQEHELSVDNASKLNNKEENQLFTDFVNKLYPVGSTYITNTNENPASYLGGTWELFDKGFRQQAISLVAGNHITLNANCASLGTCAAYLNNRTIKLLLTFTPAVPITDSTLEFFTINPNKIGLSKFSLNEVHTSMTDGGQATICYYIATTGVFTTRDVMIRGSSEANLSTSYSPSLNCYSYVGYTDMLDSFCDKFYWKRTA